MDPKKEAIDYVRERYMEEQARFNHFEDKCSKLLTSLTIVIAAFCGIVGLNSSTLFSPKNIIDWTILLLCGLSFFTLLASWGHLMLTLKLVECSVASNTRENCNYIFNSNEKDAIEQIFDCYLDGIHEIKNIIDKKSINLRHAYDELFIGAGWSIGILLLAVGKEILK